jgi:hypothetical protein
MNDKRFGTGLLPDRDHAFGPIEVESVRRWRRKAQIDAGERPGMTCRACRDP